MNLGDNENDGKSRYGGRNIIGYGNNPANPHWPRNAKVALNFVIHYEEGGESCTLHGDEASEAGANCDLVTDSAKVGERNMAMESIYEYGSRAGFWRLEALFQEKRIPATVFAVGMALERNPTVAYQIKQKCENWEVATQGYRYMDYSTVDEETQRDHLKRCIEIHEKFVGKRPVGVHLGKTSEKSQAIVVQTGGFKYDSDSYADDLPFWNLDHKRPHLVIPYSLTENDIQFVMPNGFRTGEDFAKHLKETLRFLVEEGRYRHPKMMSVGIHCRLARPARVAALAEFIDYAKSYRSDVWICTREEIADHWKEHNYPKGRGSKMNIQVNPEDLVDSDDEGGDGAKKLEQTIPEGNESAAAAGEGDGVEKSKDGEDII